MYERRRMTMREILFRGKRLDNGEWIFGMLGQYHEGIKATIVLNHFGTMDSVDFICVDPATVGQYTGLTDKNSERIFEGDIVDGEDFDEEDGYGVVRWEDGAWEVSNEQWCGTFHENYYGRNFEVIGNIHDNPELLGGC
jgi:uncharacterized phage protein (TIGR01671 family)